jgi:hypothetical protein
MVKVTLNQNLVPSRHPYTKGHPYTDLTYNVLLARKLIRVAQFLFHFKKGSAVYRGYISEYPRASFELKVLDNGVPARAATLKGLGFGGEMIIEVKGFSEAVSQDVFGPLLARTGLELTIHAMSLRD